MWNPFKRKQWAASKEPDAQKEAQRDAKEDLELGDEDAGDIAGGAVPPKEKW